MCGYHFEKFGTQQTCLTSEMASSRRTDAQGSCFMVQSDPFTNKQDLQHHLQQLMCEHDLNGMSPKELKQHLKDVKRFYEQVKAYKQKVSNYVMKK